MPNHTVVQGDCMASIAKQYGFSDWNEIFDHASNAELKRLRKNPNTLLPGDVVVIPATDDRSESAAVDQWHDFEINTQPTFLRLKLLDGDHNIYSGRKYRLEVEGAVKEGTVGSDGLIEQEIAADAAEAQLTVFMTEDTTRGGIVWTLQLGHLNPLEDLTGVQARLQNLGYDPGEIDGVLSEETRAALRGFQHKHSLEVTGEADSATLNKLKQLHDSQ
ncbi:MAG: hypothetical protein FJW30_19605 [Acidobacteria bacterium]|nr:hypothetical protein [Acidobacteriota bacterium]